MNANRKTRSCPDGETWLGYVDGSPTVPERPVLQSHLERCDRCFALVMSINKSLLETGTVQTPPHLLQKASQVNRPKKQNRWLPISAAAAILIGLGLHALNQHETNTDPWGQHAFDPLAALNTRLQAQNRAWSDLSFERTRGNGSLKVDVADELKAATVLGVATVQLTLEWEYADNLPNAQYQVRLIAFALEQMPGSGSVQLSFAQAVREPGQGANRLSALQEETQRFVASQGEPIAAFFALGQWLQNTQITLRAATQLSIPLPEQMAQFDDSKFLSTALLASGELREKLLDLNQSIAQNDTPQSILTRVEALLNALSLS
ncbi:MAG: hypothetical protein O3B73_09500 [bacterium]|nr:hypothetical protein [bacterium]